MKAPRLSRVKLLRIISAVLIIFDAAAARADVSQDQINNIQSQIESLQKQLNELKDAQQQKQGTISPVASAPATTSIASVAPATPVKPNDHVKVTVGGFIEMAAIERSKNETTDIISNWNTAIPFSNSVNAHQSEFRGSARQSRISALAQAKTDDNTLLSGYVEGDFLGAAPTATSTESNSYNVRVRAVYATIDQPDSGWHFLAGQSWSLLTATKTGITPREENIPLTIDAQYVPGFNWTRNPQVRLVKDFDDRKVWLGISAESPEVSLAQITVPAAVNLTNPGISPLNTSGSYSTDFTPDVIAKAAFDPGWGHYEVFGVERTFHDNILATFSNNYTSAFSGGAAAILPVIDKKLSVQANVMAGQGIGRYGSVQLPDLAFKPDGSLRPLSGFSALAGIIGHPAPAWDTYLYTGYEGVNRFNTASTTYGYGDYALNNAGCIAINGSCPAQTAHVWQVAGGFWDRIYEGGYGKMQVGLEDSVTERQAFSDSNGIAPHAYENVLMASFRFYPQ